MTTCWNHAHLELHAAILPSVNVTIMYHRSYDQLSVMLQPHTQEVQPAMPSVVNATTISPRSYNRAHRSFNWQCRRRRMLQPYPTAVHT